MSSEEMGEYVFTWRIKNYSSCCLVKDENILGPYFDVENIHNCEWRLFLFPKGQSGLKNNGCFVSCFLECVASYETFEEATVSFSIEIVGEYEDTLVCKEINDETFKKGNVYQGFNLFFNIDKLKEEMSNWAEDVLTLRCRIKSGHQHKLNLPESVGCTKIEVDRCCVRWQVKMPTLFEHSESITFALSDLHNLKFTLNSKEGTVEIVIHFDNKSSHQVTFAFSIFDNAGCKLGLKRAVHLFKNDKTWKFPDFITKEMLGCCKMSSSQYEFKLKCDVCISKKTLSSHIQRLEFVSHCDLMKSVPRDIPATAMQKEIQKIFMSKRFSDVTIRCKNEEFPAHKFVLRVRSPVFAAMFDQDMLENKTGTVDITDLDGKTLKAFLQFLYTETVDNMDYDIARDLILTADKYQLPSLVDECALFLKSVVSVENVCEMIAIADRINCENLKSYALNFIKVNAAEILPTAEWAEWIEGNVKLATYILSKLSTAIGTNYKLI